MSRNNNEPTLWEYVQRAAFIVSFLFAMCFGIYDKIAQPIISHIETTEVRLDKIEYRLDSIEKKIKN